MKMYIGSIVTLICAAISILVEMFVPGKFPFHLMMLSSILIGGFVQMIVENIGQ